MIHRLSYVPVLTISQRKEGRKKIKKTNGQSGWHTEFLHYDVHDIVTVIRAILRLATALDDEIFRVT